MTLQEWRATRRYHKQLPDDMAPDCGQPGWEYDAGYIVDMSAAPVTNDAGERRAFYVPLPQSDHGFTTLAAAEAFLWAEWCGPEINGSAR